MPTTSAAVGTVLELARYRRAIGPPWRELSQAQWRCLTDTSVRRWPDGRV